MSAASQYSPPGAHLHTLALAVRWGDMDALGHVNNAAYFTYLEQARVSWFETLGRQVREGVEGPVIVTAHCSFHKAIRYPATVEVSIYGASPGRSSFETSYEIRDHDAPDVVYASASARVVWVDRDAGGSVSLPEEIRRLLPA